MFAPLLIGHSFHGRWTLYFDPGVSLLITCIIFSSAVPLGSFICVLCACSSG